MNLEIAERSFQLLTGKYGILPEDIYWDPLVFPCGTGDSQYVGSAVETIEGIRLIKKRFPKTKTVLGISMNDRNETVNVSNPVPGTLSESVLQPFHRSSAEKAFGLTGKMLGAQLLTAS